jgi:hypothetical protein
MAKGEQYIYIPRRRYRQRLESHVTSHLDRPSRRHQPAAATTPPICQSPVLVALGIGHRKLILVVHIAEKKLMEIFVNGVSSLSAHSPRWPQLLGRLCLGEDGIARQSANPPGAALNCSLADGRDAALVASIASDTARIAHRITVVLEPFGWSKIESGECVRILQSVSAACQYTQKYPQGERKAYGLGTDPSSSYELDRGVTIGTLRWYGLRSGAGLCDRPRCRSL